MELKIKEDTRNPLLDRKEIKFEIQSKTTPTRESVKEELVGKTRADKNLIVIQSLKQRFGENVIEGYAKVYDNESSLKKIELEHVLNRKKKALKEKAENGKGENASEEGKENE